MTIQPIFDPARSYLVLGGDLDTTDALAFGDRLQRLRELVHQMVWREPLDGIQPLLLSHNADDFEVTFEPPEHLDPFFGEVSVAVRRPKKGPKTVTVSVRRQGFAIRQMSISEPAMADGSNVPVFADLKHSGGKALIPLLDRWIALTAQPLWMGDDRLPQQTHALMQIIYAHLQAANSPIAQSNQLAFRVGPYRSVQLVPGEWRSELFTTFEYLTSAGVAAFSNLLPAMSRLQCEIKDQSLIYEIKEFYLLENARDAASRNPGNPIDVMRSLQTFADRGPLLLSDLQLNDTE